MQGAWLSVVTLTMTLWVLGVSVVRLVLLVLVPLLVFLVVPMNVFLLLVTSFMIALQEMLNAGGYLMVLSMFRWLDALVFMQTTCLLVPSDLFVYLTVCVIRGSILLTVPTMPPSLLPTMAVTLSGANELSLTAPGPCRLAASPARLSTAFLPVGDLCMVLDARAMYTSHRAVRMVWCPLVSACGLRQVVREVFTSTSEATDGAKVHRGYDRGGFTTDDIMCD